MGRLVRLDRANFRPVTDWFRDAAGWKPGARVLDVACGSGFPALAAATHVRPGGTVVATDISPEMVAVASRRAKADGLDNIQFVEMDAEQLRFHDASFDAVTNAYGLMFCPDRQRALAEIRRVLKPGGRARSSTWDDPSKSPFFSVISGVAAPFLSLQPPDPSRPWPFPALFNRTARDVAARSRILRRPCRKASDDTRARVGRRVPSGFQRRGVEGEGGVAVGRRPGSLPRGGSRGCAAVCGRSQRPAAVGGHVPLCVWPKVAGLR